MISSQDGTEERLERPPAALRARPRCAVAGSWDSAAAGACSGRSGDPGSAGSAAAGSVPVLAGPVLAGPAAAAAVPAGALCPGAGLAWAGLAVVAAGRG